MGRLIRSPFIPDVLQVDLSGVLDPKTFEALDKTPLVVLPLLVFELPGVPLEESVSGNSVNPPDLRAHTVGLSSQLAVTFVSLESMLGSTPYG